MEFILAKRKVKEFCVRLVTEIFGNNLSRFTDLSENEYTAQEVEAFKQKLQMIMGQFNSSLCLSSRSLFSLSKYDSPLSRKKIFKEVVITIGSTVP